MKQTFHSGKKRAASDSKKHNNRYFHKGPISRGLTATVTGGGTIKTRPSNPRYQKTQNAKNTSGKVPTKKLNLGTQEVDPRVRGHEAAMSPAAVLKAVKRTVVKPAPWNQKSSTVRDLRRYISKQGG